MNRGSGKFEKTFALLTMALAFGLPGCREKRETIFDRVVSIPKQLVFDVPYLPPLCDEMAGLKKRFVAVGNSKLYYEEEGRGIPLVLISGGPGATHHAFHPYFSQIKNDARIIYYDQRGTGKSSTDNTGKTYTIKQAVEDLDALRKALGIDKWAVLGWSYGGLLAQCYALTYPEHITGLILVAANPGLTKIKMKPERDQMFMSQAEMMAILEIYADENVGKLSAAQSAYNGYLAGDWKHHRYYKPTSDELVRFARYVWNPAPGFNGLMRSQMHKISLEGKFDDFRVPTLLMEAKWDLTWDTDKVDFIRKNHPHAQFAYFEKSGHCIFADEPRKFFRVLREFL